ncbi:sugar ABC transporter ATP-binding protein [Phenylobacterium sp.]|uniref:sugar ABC transporter ATP-binding protein n=1 Tax=Phenylobacterium sp. TaxID=1871053 RepID=UPI0025FB5339|nr:sugar ABC transporter ATP-binding protein [Phenylobacterium sp.]
MTMSAAAAQEGAGRGDDGLPPPLLEARELWKRFGANPVLQGVSLTVRPHQVLALMGLNGAGKSTLMNILCGALEADSGGLAVGGEPLTFRRPADAHRAGIAMVHQELQLVPELTLAENIFLGREPTRGPGLVDVRAMNAAAAEILARLGLARLPSERVGALSVAERQVVEIAKALATRARILILDEPTAALSAAEADRLLALVGALREEGVAIILTSHRLDEVFAVATDMLILRDGRVVCDAPAAAVSRPDLIRHMLGRDVSEAIATPSPSTSDTPRRTVLEVADLVRRDRGARRGLDRVSFRVAEGEVLGLAGLMGSGRTELLEVIAGASPAPWTGRMMLNGAAFDPRAPREAISEGVAYVTEDRKASGLVLGQSIGSNICLASLDRLSALGWVSARRAAELADEMMRRLSVRASGPDQAVGELSGGNQQKVVMAKWLARRPRVLLLDEPTRGVDVGAKAAIYGLIGELSEAGVATVLASSDWPELLALSDRILVLRDGRPTARFSRGEATAETLLDFASAGGPVQPEFQHLEAA